VSRVRVLVIDDSAAVRRLLTDILASDPGVEVVGAAPNASIAMEKLTQLSPDVVTLDVEMPDVSGLELLSQIRKVEPRLPVIMFSALTQKAAATTLEALALGATDYVTKPAQTGSREASAAHVREQLIPKIKAFAGIKERIAPVAAATASPSRSTPAAGSNRSPIEALVIGSSTGGPNALADLFAALPGDLAVPVLIVQHMPPVFTQLLAERLMAKGPLKFYEAKDGDILRPGEVRIAPGNYHMQLQRRAGQHDVVTRLDQGPPENSCRPAVDVLFRSAAQIFGGRTLAVILTGMGQDGLKGSEDLHARGAQIIAQDESTSVVWGMPGFVARAGLAHSVLPLPEIAGEIRRRLRPATSLGAGVWR
jgi:two-component system, chemotaxis family, protein-glutamate methylesterase/glutaminase